MLLIPWTLIEWFVRVMLNAVPRQFRLNDDGHILYQVDPTNPMPGVIVATVGKGETILKPAVQVIDTQLTEGVDAQAATAKISEWLQGHIASVLEPLVALEKEEEGIAAPVREIEKRVHEAMGIVPRAALEELIASIDADMRRVLRQKQIKLGPVLVFIPALNKPAAVHLRALLWSLWHGKTLPAQVPSDGMVSKSLAAETEIDEAFFSAIGYPVYAKRAIRVDMLDRLISAVYDSAKDGTFKATHAMAEWLGCSIPDLYDVLEAMGHKKISDPVAVKAGQPIAVEAEASQETPVPEAVTEIVVEAALEVVSEASSAPEATVPEVTAPAAPVKPELATFKLRRGKAYGEAQERKPRPPYKKDFKPKTGGGKPQEGDRKQHRNKKPRRDDRKAPREKDDREFRVIASAPASSTSESPFSVLQQLKTKQSGQ